MFKANSMVDRIEMSDQTALRIEGLGRVGKSGVNGNIGSDDSIDGHIDLINV